MYCVMAAPALALVLVHLNIRRDGDASLFPRRTAASAFNVTERFADIIARYIVRKRKAPVTSTTHQPVRY